jgi:tetratricopeptide (TPR) repeat protein
MKNPSLSVIAALLVILIPFVNSLVAQEESPPTFPPEQAMNFFAGEWQGKGRQGNFRYQGRERVEWDLHHTVTSHRIEFFGSGFAHTLAMTRWWDPQEKKITEHQFASWGLYRKGTYEVVPHGEWFHLVGPCEQTGENGKRTHINIVTVHDEDHYTWGSVPQLGFGGNPFTEDYSRAGVAAREDAEVRTADYLKEAITFLQDKPGADAAEVMDLKKALANFLLHQSQYAEAVAVLEGVLTKQKELLTADHPDVANTLTAITQACRNSAFSSCMDNEASTEKLETALKMAKHAAELAPDDQRIWLQAFAHYRLGDTKAAQEVMRKSLAKDNAFANMLLLAAMIEHKAGDTELAQACYAMAMDFVSKLPNGGSAAWMRMAREAVGEPPALATMDKATRLEVYETVIKACPECATAYRLRGRYHGLLGQWQQARADYSKAANLLPTVQRHREGEAAIVLRYGTSEEQNAVCSKLFDEWESSLNPNPRMDMVLMCSLFPTADVDRERLAEIANEVFAELPPRAFLYIGRGMALYRLQQYEEAAATISIEGSVNPKDRILGQLFLAMSLKQLGKDVEAKQILKEATAATKSELADPGGAPLQYQDRPVVWCMVHAALDEAEQLINEK